MSRKERRSHQMLKDRTYGAVKCWKERADLIGGNLALKYPTASGGVKSAVGMP